MRRARPHRPDVDVPLFPGGVSPLLPPLSPAGSFSPPLPPTLSPAGASPPIPPAPFPPQRGRKGGLTATFDFVAPARLLLGWHLWVGLRHLGAAPSPRRLSGFGCCGLCGLCGDSGLGHHRGFPPIPPAPFPPQRGGKGELTATFCFVASAELLLASYMWVCLQRLGTAPSPRRLSGFGRRGLCGDSGLGAAATKLHRLQPKGQVPVVP